MIHEKIYLNDEKTGYVEVYALDPQISYKVYRKRPAMIICPGGAYLISAVKEGEAVAAQYLAQGYSCFVLRYTTFLKDRDETKINKNGYYPTQILELLETIHMIHMHAEEWNIDTTKIFATGFSAGGHIIGTVANRWNDSYFINQLSFIPKGDELKLAGCILGYPMLEGPLSNHPNIELRKQAQLMETCLYGHQKPTVEEREQLSLINHITKNTIPTFIWHTTDDNVTSPELTSNYVLHLQQRGVVCEYHLLSGGKHGLSIANELYAKDDTEINSRIEKWFPLAIHWLKYIKDEGE